MTLPDISLSYAQLDKLFPFHFIVNEELEIIHSGQQLTKLSKFDSNNILTTQFKIIRPEVEVTSYAQLLSFIDKVLVIRSLSQENLLLRGTLQVVNGKVLAFLGFPWFASLDSLASSGVVYGDLGYLDPSFDYLNLIRSHEITIEETLNVLETNQKHKEVLQQQYLVNEETTTRLSLLIESMQSGVLLEDEHRKIIFTNELFCNFFSIPAPPKALVGVDCSQSAEQSKHHFIDEEEFVRRIDIIIKERKHVLNELLEMKGGRVLSRDFIPIFNQDRYLGHLWSYTDVTDRIHAEKKIEEQRLFYETVLNEIPADIAIFNNEHRYLFANRHAIKDDSVRKWIIGKDDFDYCRLRNLDISIAEGRRSVFVDMIASKKPLRLVDAIKKDGKTFYILRIFYPYVVNEEVKMVIGYAVDITEHRQREIELQTERERYRNLLEVINDGVIRFDGTGKIDFYNPAFEKIIGHPHDINKDGNILDLVAQEHIFDLQNAIEIALQKGDSKQLVVKLKDNVKYLDLFITPSLNKDEPNILAGRISDITEREQREEYLSTLFEKEKELNSLKTRFIRITSHELRTPLATILSNAEILHFLLTQKFQEQFSQHGKYTNQIIKEVFRMNDLLAELIVVGRMEDGKGEYNIECNNFAVYLQEIVKDNFSPYTDGRNLEVSISSDISDELFCKRMLKHAIVNIINNAFKYSIGEQSPKLKVYHEDNWVTVEVQDYGIGIPENEIGQVFNSFYRCSNATAINGTGIGLMLTNYIVQSHGGNIDIASKLNVGTIIKVKLPSQHKKQ